MIQIPVEMYWERADGEPFRVHAFTISVSAHGCLLAMEMKPEEGQRMRLRNPKSAREQSGTVVRAQRSRDGSFAVAFAFDSPAPDFWAAATPPEDWLVSKG